MLNVQQSTTDAVEAGRDASASRAFDLFWRLRHGEPSEDDLRRLGQAYLATLRDPDGPSVESRLRLPSTQDRKLLRERDHWLREAAKLLPAESAWSRADQLRQAWERFVTYGEWRQWRLLDEIPTEADPFKQALFRATLFNRSNNESDLDGGTLGTKRLVQIVGNVFRV